jgi:uncharacterized protein
MEGTAYPPPPLFQVFVKPAGARCNLSCRYCYYLEKKGLYGEKAVSIPSLLLEEYIVQHIEASSDREIRFSWHGGEPTILGLDYFRLIRKLQEKHLPRGREAANGMQTNGTLLDEDWGRFLSEEGFSVGLSLDGPEDLHNTHRLTAAGGPTYKEALRGYEILRRFGVPTDILCVVNSHNVMHPGRTYRFFREIGARYISFLPCVERLPGGRINPLSVTPEAWGNFLCTVFDLWIANDIGRLKVQIFEESARTAFGLEHSLCIFRPVCGDVPVLEHNGDFYACDHFVDPGHLVGNIIETPLADLLKSPAQRAFGLKKRQSLPKACLQCGVLEMCHGGCPKNRFMPSGEKDKGLNYLCAGYKQFFTHCLPWVRAVAEEWRRGGR